MQCSLLLFIVIFLVIAWRAANLNATIIIGILLSDPFSFPLLLISRLNLCNNLLGLVEDT